MRDIREGTFYTEQCRQLGISVQRLDEVLGGVIWAMANGAEQLPQVPGTGLRVLTTAQFPGAPRLRIFFRIESPNRVLLEWIERIEDDPDEPV